MKKFSVSALCCVAACALCLGGCNKNADTTEAGATCAEKSCSEKSSCCDSAAKKSGCCAEKAGAQN